MLADLLTAQMQDTHLAAGVGGMEVGDRQRHVVAGSGKGVSDDRTVSHAVCVG